MIFHRQCNTTVNGVHEGEQRRSPYSETSSHRLRAHLSPVAKGAGGHPQQYFCITKKSGAVARSETQNGSSQPTLSRTHDFASQIVTFSAFRRPVTPSGSGTATPTPAFCWLSCATAFSRSRSTRHRHVGHCQLCRNGRRTGTHCHRRREGARQRSEAPALLSIQSSTASKAGECGFW